MARCWTWRGRVGRVRCCCGLAVLLFGLAAGAQDQAVAAAPPSFSFAVLSDPHLSEKASWEAASLGTHVERFLRCFEAMATLTGLEKPDFALICGDIHPAELQKCLERVALPLHVVAGNHEGTPQRQVLREMFKDDFKVAGKPADYYSFVHKGVRFVALCDAGGGDHVGHLCSEYITPPGQCEWLEGELAAPEAAKIVFAHIPPEPTGADRTMCLARNDARYLKDVLARTPAAALFFGHQHLPTREFDFGGSRCFVLRSCAWNFKGAPLGFLLVTVNGTTLTTREILTSPATPPAP